VSAEADGLFVLLERAGGERSVRSIRQHTNLGGVVSPAAAELTKLGLLEKSGTDGDTVLRLTSAAEGVALLATWSMRS
jgi:hypothetical protein